MTQYDLGQVVGADGQDGVDGSDGSTIWYTSTAPTYANSKYTFTISNLTGKTGFTIAVNDIIFYDTYYYIVSAVNSTTVDCATRVSIKGSDASVTVVDNLNSDSSTSVLSAKQGKVLNTNKIETSAIATSFGSTTSDSKVPSEKLTKTELDKKIATSSTSGLVKNDGSIMTSGTGSSNWAIGNHTHSGYLSATKVTSWSSTVSDSNVPSEKLVKNTIDGLSIPTKTSDLTNDGADGTNVYVANNDSRLSDSRTPTSHTHGNLTNDGKVGSNANYIVVTGTGGAITSVQKLGNITYDGKIGSTSGKPVITTTSGTVTTGSFGSTAGTFAEGNHTHSGYLSATKVTSWQSTPSDSNVPSEKLVKDTFDDIEDLIGDAITYINQ